METFHLTYKPYGEAAVLIEWPARIEKPILTDIQGFYNEIIQLKLIGVVDVNFVYSSMLVMFEPEVVTCDSLIIKLAEVYQKIKGDSKIPSKRWRIPVCYESEFGPDLEDLAKQKGLSEKEVIRLHTEPNYTIFGMGFLPGFLYLGGLLDRLFIPRKETPALAIPKGSIAIGGSQTGIYPQTSPGGWHIIGRTPVSIFDVDRSEPTFVSVGDEIEFYAVSKPEYDVLCIEMECGVYKIEEL